MKYCLLLYALLLDSVLFLCCYKVEYYFHNENIQLYK